jgi:hypothetical protein
MTMDIIIPTRGRVGRQRTLQYMSPELRRRTIMVCPHSETGKHGGHPYSEGVRFIPQPDPDMTIAAKRAWVLRYWNDYWLDPERRLDSLVHGFAPSDKIVMLDDDLRFYVREQPDQSLPEYAKRLRYADYTDQVLWFDALERTLGPEVPHAGFGPRQGNGPRLVRPGVWNQPDPWESPGRMMYSLGYHVPTVVSRCILGRIETREDFDLSLQLLLQGFPNQVCHTFVVGQAKYNEAGGASEERTLERSNSDAHRLAELYPGLVRVVHRDYEGSPREEVVVSWVKALRQGQQWRRDHPSGGEGVVQAGAGSPSQAAG